jgi:hypothetical protein
MINRVHYKKPRSAWSIIPDPALQYWRVSSQPLIGRVEKNLSGGKGQGEGGDDGKRRNAV